MLLQRFFLTLWFFFAATASVAADTPDCLKVVFGEYCLGGAAPTESTGDEPDAENKAGDRIVEAQLRGKTIQIEWQDRRIVSVTRLETPGDWLTFTDWKKRIVRQYGRARDESTLPPYATSRSSRRNAIVSGRGIAKVLWQQQGWRIELIWDNTESLKLRYALEPQASNPDDEL